MAIFYNLYIKYCDQLGIAINISEEVYQLIHHPAKSKPFLQYALKPTIWGVRAQRENVYRPYKKYLIDNLEKFQEWLEYLRKMEGEGTFFLRMIHGGRHVEKKHVHVEISRNIPIYSILLVEFLKLSELMASSKLNCFYLHHILDVLCNHCVNTRTTIFSEEPLVKLRKKIAYEPQLDFIEEFVKEQWDCIYEDYLIFQAEESKEKSNDHLLDT